MNETLRQLDERKSVRVFEDRAIEVPVRQAILRAAVMAPTACNQQRYTILEVTDQEKKDRLAVLCDHQPFIAKAKMVLIFLADTRRWYKAYQSIGLTVRHPAVGDLMLAISDATVAAQNAVVAAESLGVGSCYIGDAIEHAEIMREMLSLPSYVMPAAMLVFGYPTRQQQEREKSQRIDMKHIVHENAYRDPDGEELCEMLAYKAGAKKYEDWLTSVCEGKYACEFCEEMNRSMAVYLKDYLA